jgi:transcriptional regulator with XRE-family HTH domain
VGVAQQAIDAIESGDTERPRKLLEIAEVLKTSQEYLLGLTDDVGTPAYLVPHDKSALEEAIANEEAEKAALSDLAYHHLRRDVPVLEAKFDAKGDFFLTGKILDSIRRPINFTLPDIKAMYVARSSMWPKYEEGRLVYFTYSRPPAPGDDAVLTFRGPPEKTPAAIRQGVEIQTDRVICQEFHPLKSQTIERGTIAEIGRIVPYEELVPR